jgi:hypothetical protein
MPSGVFTPDTVRAEAEARLLAGESVNAVAQACGLPANTIYGWLSDIPKLREAYHSKRGRVADYGALVETKAQELAASRPVATHAEQGNAHGRGVGPERGEPVRRITFADLMIQTIDQELVPFWPNEVQAGYLDAFWPTWREDVASGRPMPRRLREIILKARRFGFTTLIAALYFCDTLNRRNTTTIQVAQEHDTAVEIFEIIHRFWENLPPDKQDAAGEPKSKSRHSLIWDKIDSRYLVRTANSRAGTGRGLTIHNLHCSESAFYQDRRVYRALLQAVSKTSGNVFIESTANGEAGDGEQYCQIYREAAGEIQPKGARRNDFTARFFPWWSFVSYEVAPERGFVRAEDEVTIVEKYGLDEKFGVARTNAKLQWRRLTIAEPDMGPVFAQEYPGDAREAFLVSGNRFFPEWDACLHTYDPGAVTVQRYWHAFGGYDWGYAATAPAVFLLARIDNVGHVLIVDERTMVRQTDPQQAQTMLACLEEHGIDPADCPIYSDPSIWNPKSDNFGRIFHNVSELANAGLWMVKASNVRSTQTSGWQNVRRYLYDTTVARDTRTGNSARNSVSAEVRTCFLRINANTCRDLVRTFPLQLVDPMRPNDLDTTGPDHWVDALRYLLGSKQRPTDGSRAAVRVWGLAGRSLGRGPTRTCRGSCRTSWRSSITSDGCGEVWCVSPHAPLPGRQPPHPCPYSPTDQFFRLSPGPLRRTPSAFQTLTRPAETDPFSFSDSHPAR